MKDFTEKYSRMIDAEIRARYPYRETRPAALAALHADAIYYADRKSGDAHRNGLAIRKAETAPIFYGITHAARAAWKAVEAYAKAAETYPGELDAWSYQEERRIHRAALAFLAEPTPPPHTIRPETVEELRQHAPQVYDDGDRIRVYWTTSPYETGDTYRTEEEARAALNEIYIPF